MKLSELKRMVRIICFNNLVDLPMMNCSIGFLIYLVIVTKPWQIHIWEPSWTIQIFLDIIRPVASFISFVMKERKIKQLVFNNIEESWLIHQTINNFFFLFYLLECSKQSVPYRQPSSIILIQTISVGSMVNSRGYKVSIIPTVKFMCKEEVVLHTRILQEIFLSCDVMQCWECNLGVPCLQVALCGSKTGK